MTRAKTLPAVCPSFEVSPCHSTLHSRQHCHHLCRSRVHEQGWKRLQLCPPTPRSGLWTREMKAFGSQQRLLCGRPAGPLAAGHRPVCHTRPLQHLQQDHCPRTPAPASPSRPHAVTRVGAQCAAATCPSCLGRQQGLGAQGELGGVVHAGPGVSLDTSWRPGSAAVTRKDPWSAACGPGSCPGLCLSPGPGVEPRGRRLPPPEAQGHLPSAGPLPGQAPTLTPPPHLC